MLADDLDKYRSDIQKFIAEMQAKKKLTHSDTSSEPHQKIEFDNLHHSIARIQLRPFPFDPNTLPEHKWVEMGFSNRQAQMVGRYRNKGGRFRKKSDLKRLYFMTDEIYETLKPYILLPDTIEQQIKKPAAQREKTEKLTDLKVELNSSDTSELVKLPGIGSTFARRIYAYKQRLGGFYEKHQLLEVYGMDSIRYAMIEPYIEINPWLVRKIHVNTASFEELAAHPYISKNLAISLINYRLKHGNFEKLEDLLKLELMDETLFQKLAPYLIVK